MGSPQIFFPLKNLNFKTILRGWAVIPSCESNYAAFHLQEIQSKCISAWLFLAYIVCFGLVLDLSFVCHHPITFFLLLKEITPKSFYISHFPREYSYSLFIHDNLNPFSIFTLSCSFSQDAWLNITLEKLCRGLGLSKTSCLIACLI